jgi:hypothetical protein
MDTKTIWRHLAVCHQTLEYNFHTCTLKSSNNNAVLKSSNNNAVLKSSNNNAVFIWYNVLIGCFLV